MSFKLVDRTEVKRKADSSDLPAVDTGFAYAGPEQLVGDFDFLGTVTDEMPVEVTPVFAKLTQAGELWRDYTNLMPTHSFESGIGAWTKGGTNTIAANSTRSLHGSYGLLCVYQDDATVASHAFTPVANTSYIVIAHVYIPNTWDGGNIEITEDGTYAGASETVVASSSAYEGQWQRITTTITFAADVTGSISFNATSPPSAGKQLYIDNVMIVEGSDFFPACDTSSSVTNDTIRDVASGDIVFSTNRNTLKVEVGSRSAEVFTCPTPIRRFDVLDAPSSLIAVMDEDYLYVGALTMDVASGNCYNAFRLTRFTRLPLSDCPVSRFRCTHDQTGTAVLIQTVDEEHFWLTLSDQQVDFAHLSTATDQGYVYVDGSYFTATPTYIDTHMEEHHPGAGSTKTLYVEVRDERGVPMENVTVQTVPYLAGVGVLWSSITAEMSITGPTLTNAQGIASFTITYVKAEAAIATIDIEVFIGNWRQKHVASRAHGTVD
jgi:hypothetical protein